VHVSSLHIYPVKSIAPIDLDEAVVEPWGLAGDRRWMAVDEHGAQRTAREHRQLLSIEATPSATGLTLTGPHADPIVVTTTGEAAEASVWKTRFPVTDIGPAAADWLTKLIGKPTRLMYLHDPRARPITDEPGGEPGDVVSMADAFPLMLTTTASLQQVNDWIAEDHPDDHVDPLVMRRFRPSVVVEGAEAFAESAWSELQIGDVTFRAGGECARCVLTTIDPWTLKSGKEPIRTLARRHSWDRKTWFGLNLVPTSQGSIRLGDSVEPTLVRPS
jgi:uncharacterized protein YcbX